MKALEPESGNEKAIRLLTYIIAEWNSDPSSIACFDLRIVDEAKKLIREINDEKAMLIELKALSSMQDKY